MTRKRSGYLIAEAQPFAQSLLWDIQQAYYADKGVQAWRQDELPHYVTSNPTVANSYAEIVLACWRDQQRLAAAGNTGDEPLYICELGSGSGRFAFHFLRRNFPPRLVPVDFFPGHVSELSGATEQQW